MPRPRTPTSPNIRKQVGSVSPEQQQLFINSSKKVKEQYAAGIVEPPVNGPWATEILIENNLSAPLTRGQVGPFDDAFAGTIEGATAAIRDGDQLFDIGINCTSTDVDWSKHWGKGVVPWETIGPSEIGRGNAAGVAVAQVFFDAHPAGDRFPAIDHCEPDQGSSGFMTPHWSGSWQILWRDTGKSYTDLPGIVWCVVCKSGPWQRVLKVIPTGDIPWNGSGTANVWINGVDTGETITVHHNWADSSNQGTISSGSQAKAKWFWDERKWVIVDYPSGAATPASSATFWRKSSPTQYETQGTGSYENITQLSKQFGTTDIDVDVNGEIQCQTAGTYQISYSINLVAASTGVRDQKHNEASIVSSLIRAQIYATSPPFGQAQGMMDVLYLNAPEVAYDPDSNPVEQVSHTSINATGLLYVDALGIIHIQENSEDAGHQLDIEVHVERVGEKPPGT